MRYMAIDLGGKRTGIAVGDDVTRIATPVDVIVSSSRDELLRQIGLMIAEHEPGELVVGCPLNMDGTAGPAAKNAMQFVEQLSKEFELTVHLQDERQTSQAADEKMAMSGLTYQQKKRRRDALAASVILQDFLDSL